MQEELFTIDQRQYTMLLQKEMSGSTEGTIYFQLPDQENYLYEYEGDLDEVLDDLPEIYSTVEAGIESGQLKETNLTLTPEAFAVIEHLKDYFDQTGERELKGEHDYNFQFEGDRLLILPNDNFGEVVTISQTGEIESTFEPERFEHLMDRFAIAYQQMQMIEPQQENEQDWELG